MGPLMYLPISNSLHNGLLIFPPLLTLLHLYVHFSCFALHFYCSLRLLYNANCMVRFCSTMTSISSPLELIGCISMGGSLVERIVHIIFWDMYTANSRTTCLNANVVNILVQIMKILQRTQRMLGM